MSLVALLVSKWEAVRVRTGWDAAHFHFTEGHTVRHFPLGFLTYDSRGEQQQQQQQRPATGHVFMTGQEQAQLLLALIHQRISHL